MVLTATLEVIGVSSVMPFLAVLGDTSVIRNNEYLFFIYNYFNFNNNNSFLQFLGVLSIGILLFSATIKIFTYSKLYYFANLRRYTIGSKLFNKYLQQNYSFFLTKNSSNISRIILSEVDLMINQILIPLLMLITYSIILLFLISFLIMINPLLSLILFVLFGGSYSLIYFITRKYISKIGELREKANTKRFKIINESIGGIKDIKVLGKEKVYYNFFDNPSYDFSKYTASTQVLSSIPQFLIEVITFGSILIIAMYLLLSQGSALDTILPILGLYALSTLKLKPASNQIFVALTYLKFGASSLNAIYKEMKIIDKKGTNLIENSKLLKFDSKISFENVNFSYSPSVQILKDINIVLQINTTIGIIGKTGAGKSTFIDLLLGLLYPTNGLIKIDNTILNEITAKQWQNNIGYVSQNIFLSDTSILENIAFGVEKNTINVNKVKEVAKISKIDEFIMTLEDGYNTEVGERGVRLSGGQIQRIGIARALYNNPSLLVLDEATSALDTQTELEIMNAINEMQGEKTIIMIAHRLNTLKNCDLIIELDNGKICKK
jgi:ABC-type bacteriocin/lantibiotic exporter with double-glycine peptidase domain